jgi:adenylate cyclase
MAGVYLHAAAIRQLLGNGGPERLAGVPVWLLLFATGLLFAGLSIRPGGMFLAAILILAVAEPLAVAVLAYHAGLVLPLGGMIVSALGGMAGMVGYRWLVVDSSARYLRRAFSLYLPKSQVDQLVEASSAPALGGEQRTVSILFLDIEGFTAIAETMEPEETAALLNRCFDRLGEIIERHQGHIDKFVGDGLIAIFGAPLADPEHALHAVVAAIEMLDSLDREPLETATGHLRIRIGINTGSVLIGNIGSSRRFNYTVIGDAVNLAARLEALNKVYGIRLLVSEETAAACEGVRFREIDRVAVSGRTAPTAVFQPLGDPGIAEDYGEALALYRQGDFRNAAAILARISDKDPAATALAERCRKYEESPPRNWDSIFRPEGK